MANPLPPGWRMTNSEGTISGPSRPTEDERMGDANGSDDENESTNLDIQPDSPGWEDMEDDSEPLSIKAFFSDRVYPTAQEMLQNAATEHGFNFLEICSKFNLDFISAVKLVNYVRQQAANGQVPPDVGQAELWSGDEYLQPFLEDDHLLICLGDIVGFGGDENDAVDFDERAALQAAKQQHSDLNSIEE